MLDYESLPSVITVEITAFDGDLFSNPGILTVNLQNVNEAPVFTLAEYNFNVYGSKAGQVVINNLTQFASDPDQNDVLTFLIFPSNPNFFINPSTGAISFTSDYPSSLPKLIRLPVVARDLGNLNDLANITVRINDTNQPPVLTNLPERVQVLENTASGTTVFTVSSQDVDGGDTITYTMQAVNTATQLFSISSAGVISVKSGIILDYESLPSIFYLTIRAFDGQLYSTPANLTIQLINVNEAPRFNPSQFSFTVNEGKAGQILVPSLITYIIDEDANEQFTFSLVPGTNSDRFSIDQSTGAIRFSADYDTDPNRAPNQVTLDVLVRDTGLGFSTGKITLSISNVNQVPMFTNLPKEVQISPDTPAGTVVFTVSFSDPDSLDTLTLNGMFTNTVSSNSFSFNQINGELKYLGLVSIPGHVLQCTLSDGKVTTTAQLNILVYQDPQVTTTLVPTTTTASRELLITNLPQTITIAENVQSQTIVFKVTTSNAVTSPLSFQLQHLNTGDLFAINNDGDVYVTNGAVLDYESLPTLIYLTITANNGAVSSKPVNLTVRLSNVNEPPKFNQSLYSFIIGDAKLGDDLTQTLIPYINDPTSKLFSLASTTYAQYFAINPTTGAIRLATNPPLLPKQVNLTVIVQDSSIGGQTSTAVISLFMNLPPRFTNLPSTVTIPSDTRPRDAIFTVQTTDPNPGDILTLRLITSQSKFGLGSITNDVFVQLGDSFSANESYIIEFSVSDGQKLVNSALTVHVYIPAKTITEIPTSLTTKPTVVDPKTTTSNTVTDSNDSLPLLERPWAITAIIITAVLVPTLIILVAVIICKRRNGHDDRFS
ncbi:cadherin-related tumor suppressor isoform X2 [Patella vulgata]|uniref:cadherin-related tumor suppressor isoform X2 n=1 Tax=Patella vulgata TaxID=6465 RepID=UPI0024A7C3F5|nr:cadherin-related tumor suppressor isoform X2 [Patella vulgata]